MSTTTGRTTGSARPGRTATKKAAAKPRATRAKAATETPAKRSSKPAGGRSSTSTRRQPASGRSSSARRATSASNRDRFEARRLEIERGRGLRRLRLVLGLAAVTSLAVGVVAFVNSSWFDVDEVVVSGNERATADAIADASGIRLGQGLLEVDLDAATSAVELVPWVGTATISRSWTGAIDITVVERPASAVIPAGDGFALVDDHGRQLEIVDQRPPGYLPITGIEGSGVAGEPAPDTILPIVALADALPDDVLDRVAAIAVIDGDINLELVDGGRANLGEGIDLGPKLQAFETVLARVDLTCLDTIDVRVPDSPVVTRTAELPPLGLGVAGANGSTDPAGTAAGEEPDSAPVDC